MLLKGLMMMPEEEREEEPEEAASVSGLSLLRELDL